MRFGSRQGIPSRRVPGFRAQMVYNVTLYIYNGGEAKVIMRSHETTPQGRKGDVTGTCIFERRGGERGELVLRRN